MAQKNNDEIVLTGVEKVLTALENANNSTRLTKKQMNEIGKALKEAERIQEQQQARLAQLEQEKAELEQKLQDTTATEETLQEIQAKLNDIEQEKSDLQDTLETTQVQLEEARRQNEELEARLAAGKQPPKEEPEEIPEFLEEYIERYPENKEFHVTSDRQVFLKPNRPLAVMHQNGLQDNKEVKTYKTE